MANFQIGHALPDDDEDDEGNIHLHSSEICKIILDTNVPQKCFPTYPHAILYFSLINAFALVYVTVSHH